MHHPLLMLAGGVWAVPGGEVESGEAPLAAALRELGEECDVDTAAVVPIRAGGAIWLRSLTVRLAGLALRQSESFHAVAVDDDPGHDPCRSGTLDADVIDDRRWWTCAELRQTGERVTPMCLADLVAPLTAAVAAALQPRGAPVTPAVPPASP